MKLARLVASIVSVFVAGAASADWDLMSSSQVVRGAEESIIRYDFSTAVDSSAYPISGCTGSVEARFDPSIGDSSTDARVEIRTCRNSSDTWQRCRGSEFTGVKDGVTWTGLNATTPGEEYILAHPIAATSGGDTARVEIRCTSRESLRDADPTDAAGMSGAYMTWATVDYMSSMTRFEGLDPTIPWVDFWIDPYNGSDSNAGTYASPFRTLAKWKTMAGFGTRFTIKNGGRDRAMYISNQTFPYPTDEACQVGEVITYDSGGSTSRILDIDPIAGKFVVETVTGGTLDASDVITAGSRTGSACAWTVGTRTPSLWDEAVEGGGTGTYLCAADNTDTCLAANRYTTTNCAGGAGTCGASIEASIALKTTPTRYDGRIVSILDVEDPSIPVRIHSDRVTPGELDNTELGSNSDRNGIFITGNSSSYGCLGVANIVVEHLVDDAISQHQEGCTKTLNVTVEGVRNVANAQNNNAVTTHNGDSGRGQVVVVNGGGYNLPTTNTQGSAIAPTGVSAMTIIGTKPWITDGSIQIDTNGLTTLSGNGGNITIIGGEVFCRGMLHANGCQGHNLTTTGGVSQLNLVRHLSRAVGATSGSVNMTTSGNPGTLRVFRGALDGGRGIFTNAANGAISINVKGTIFDDLDYFWYDFTSTPANVTGSISGVYDDDGSNRYFVNSANRTTAALADAQTPVDVLSDIYSRQSDANEYVTSDSSYRCAQSGTQCFDTYTESFTLDFPEVIYDYLPVPIRGYLESGTRSYGAR